MGANAPVDPDPDTAHRVTPSGYTDSNALIALVGPELANWYRLSPQERWREAEQFWLTFTDLGGSLDVEPDSHSPFFHV